MDKLKKLVGVEKPPEEKTWTENLEDEFNENCSLSRTTRLYLFGICFVLGWVLSTMAVFALPDIGTNPEKFATLYTIGNVVALCSTCFMWGPFSQVKKMFKEERRIATIIYLTMIIVTLVVAFEYTEAWAVILCLIIQFLAMGWYCLSYIPYGRKMVKNMFSGCFS